MVESIKDTLVKRDGVTVEQAEKKIQMAKKKLARLLSQGKMDDAEYICESEFGLEPDYIFDLM